HVATMLFHTGRINQRTQRAHGATLFADHLAHVRLRYAYLDARRAFALNLAHVHRVGIIDEGLHHHFDRVAHKIQVWSAEFGVWSQTRTTAPDSGLATSLAACLINRRTVSVGCAPLLIQYCTRSLLRLISAGSRVGLYVPRFSRYAPSRLDCFSLTTMR